jgi:hypothetical protein
LGTERFEERVWLEVECCSDSANSIFDTSRQPVFCLSLG